MSVTQLAWFDEDRKFAVAFGDGELMLCSRNEFEEPVKVEAHQVSKKQAVVCEYLVCACVCVCVCVLSLIHI